jgi:glutathione S-transferase
VPPLVHILRARRLSGGRELPILTDKERVVVGSTAIIDYLDGRWPEPLLLPTEPTARSQARLWADWADRLLAIEARRLLTSHFASQPRAAECYFLATAPRRQRLALRTARRPFALFAAAYRGASPAAVRRARRRADDALALLDGALGERRHLVGDSITLADLSVAIAANTALVPVPGRERYAGSRTLEWVEELVPAPYKRWL